ncbi:MAG: hypothetical protein HRT77_08360 [Halioglobus sp.]|nr:hypothetical protein [Halioglobus sp.]
MHSLGNIFAAVILTATTSASAAIITVNDQGWSQPDLFLDYSYNQFADVCDLNTGACSGQLSGGEDLTGYTWASVEDINALFNSLLGTDLLGPGPSSYTESASVWAAEILGQFNATNSGRNPQVSGHTRTARGRNRHYIAGIQDRRRNRNDNAFTDRRQRNERQDSTIGGWFYRDLSADNSGAQPVPSPSTPALVVLGLVALTYRFFRNTAAAGETRA